MKNRQLKFRVWDGSIMYYPSYSLRSSNCDSMGGACLSQGLGKCSYIEDKVIIQQFTGLTDKNGKEIYEGDIIKFEKKNKNYEVIYYEGHPCFMFLPTDVGPNLMEFFSTVNFSHFIPNHWQTKKYEIIGNIFETPELLKN